MSTHNNQKKIAVINDLSGFGRCSIAVAWPIISVMKVQCCPVPTSIFSNHTGFESYFFDDYTDKMQAYIDQWKKLDLRFNGISTGFLGSKDQIEIVSQFLKDFKTEDTIVIMDPVMGDYGKAYTTYTHEMCQEMKKLVKHADILTPNLTEACILADVEYKENMNTSELTKIAKHLSEKGPEKIVITGVPVSTYLGNFCYEKGKEPKMLRIKKIGESRSGTGDVFSAILAADAVNGVDFETSVRKAAAFIKKCIERSIEMDLPLTDGVCIEEFLNQL
ncbi:MAG: pyridoxamine kinase [Lachnospiraceae bacterium]|nr:pyridoxamine kinase [Lachnospiraceae bacterium]MBQ5559416.1 pyridoxamine kinase [Lachnospiraceae bacterium]MCR4801568.1 pyridoxamine kinase [Lachnospiraceae bacterium]